MPKKTKKRKPDIRWMIEEDISGSMLNYLFYTKKAALASMKGYGWKGVTPIEVEITKVK